MAIQVVLYVCLKRVSQPSSTADIDNLLIESFGQRLVTRSLSISRLMLAIELSSSSVRCSCISKRDRRRLRNDLVKFLFQTL